MIVVVDVNVAAPKFGDFFGEYHCGFSLVGNVEALFSFADDVDGAGSVRVSKEETGAMGAIGGGISGGGCFGGGPGGPSCGSNSWSLLPPNILLRLLIELPRCCFFF